MNSCPDPENVTNVIGGLTYMLGVLPLTFIIPCHSVLSKYRNIIGPWFGKGFFL